MSTVIQKYKKLIKSKKDLELNHELLMIDLGMLVRGRKNHRIIHSKTKHESYISKSNEKDGMLKDIDRLIEKKTQKIKEKIPEIKENKKKLKKVNSELCKLCG